MRFLKYYLKEGTHGEYKTHRSKELSEKEAKKVLHTKCSKALKDYLSGGVMFRGIRGDTSHYKFTDPSKGEKRKSAFATGNYYNDIIENAPEWSKFPQRSIVATTDFDNADDRGTAFDIFPFNGFKIGICPADDIFWSFKKLSSDAGYFNDEMRNIIVYFSTPKWSKPSVKSDDWKSLRDFMKSVTKKDLDGLHIGSEFLGYDTLYDAVTDIINPRGFKVVSSLPKVKDKEVWTDSPCLLVEHDYSGNYFNSIK